MKRIEELTDCAWRIR
jgi:4-hydroxyproline epimerase